MNKLKLFWMLWKLHTEKDKMKWIQILQSLLTMVGPDLKAAMVKALKEWQVKAAQTATPVDDLVCNILLFLLGA